MQHRSARRTLAVALATCAGAAAARAQLTIYTLNGLGVDDRFGTSLASVGDLNADGRPEFVVGAPEDGNIFSPGVGYARVYNGATGALLYNLSGVSGVVAGDAFGTAVGASDVNADGKPDIIVGAPLSGAGGTLLGKVLVFNGATGSLTPLFTFNGASTGEQLGAAVAGAGDVNGDGKPDVIAGAPANNGSRGLARVYSGLNGSVIWTINGTNANDNLGFSVDGVGDLNADGKSEFIIGSRLAGAKVYNGATGLAMFTIPAVGSDRVGTSVAGCGDVNNDGKPDFVVGSPQDGNIFSPAPGYAKVYSGASGAVLWTLNGDVNGDRFGWTVGGGKDLNGDGRMDVIVGADQNTSGAIGYVRTFSGATGLPFNTTFAVNGGERLGASVDLLGDLNGDGLGEFGGGAPGTQVGANSQQGQVTVWGTTLGGPPAFNAFCFGDNVDPNVTTDCPCSNFGGAGHGCANSVNAAGGLLAASGTPNPDTVVLFASGMPSTSSCIFLQGDAVTDTVFGDGVLCTGGSLVRLRTKTAVSGAAQFPDSTDTITLSARGGVAPGSAVLRYYQTYYRNAAAFCTVATFNVTNGWKITW